MLVKVYIKRHIQDGKYMEVSELIKKMRLNAMLHEGYISGETLVGTDDPQILMVVSTWRSMKDWVSWKDNEDRKKIDAQLEKLQIKPTQYESYVFSKYRIYVKKGFPDPIN